MYGKILKGSDEEIEDMLLHSKKSRETISDGIKHPKLIIYDIETDTNQQIDDNGKQFSHKANHIEVNVLRVSDNHTYEDSLEMKKPFPGYNCIEEFCRWLFTDENKGATVMAHNGSGYDNKFILNWCVNHGFQPSKKIKRGSGIMYMRYNKFNMRFIDPLNFFSASLKKLPAMWGLSNIMKGDFPHKFNTPENQNYIGVIPDIKYYGAENKSPEDFVEFTKWYETQKHITDWNFKNEISKYCRDDVEILSKSVLACRKQFYEQQNVDPFRYITLPSLCMELFQARHLQDKTIVSNDSNKPISKKSRELIIHLDNKNILREKLLLIDTINLPKFDRHLNKVVIDSSDGEPLEFENLYKKDTCKFVTDGFDKKKYSKLILRMFRSWLSEVLPSCKE